MAASLLLSSSLMTGAAQALFEKDMTKARRVRLPESAYQDIGEGLKSYDVKVGDGQEAKLGDRVAVHYEARWKGVTFRTSRQGMGVTGGSPIGFDVGTDPRYGTLPGLDRGVRGMRVGGLRKLLIPPALAYGDKGVGGEIPAGATLEFDVELLSIKNNPFGSRVKVVEG